MQLRKLSIRRTRRSRTALSDPQQRGPLATLGVRDQTSSMPTPEDEVEVPETPDVDELQLTVELGEHGLRNIDDALKKAADGKFLKVARVIVNALKALQVRPTELYVNVCVRRVLALVDEGILETRGNVRRPRWSEARLRHH
jgi:hypothetical protein